MEKSAFKRDVGFHITLAAPANRVLESFGTIPPTQLSLKHQSLMTLLFRL